MCTYSTIADKCVTVTLRRTQFCPTVCDKQVTDSVDISTGTHKSGRYMKRLLKNCKQLEIAARAYDEVYRYVMANSLPWLADGVRIIPNAQCIEFCNEVDRLKSNAARAVDDLYNHWEDAVDADKSRLGALFNPLDYPDKDEMRSKWTIRLTVAPIADSGDFRVAMSESIKQELDEELRNVERDSTTYVLKQLMEPVAAMASKLSTRIGEQGSVFRDTLVSNVRDVAERAKKLNINNDVTIDEITNSMLGVLEDIQPNDLRTSDVMRADVANKMSSIQQRISAYF